MLGIVTVDDVIDTMIADQDRRCPEVRRQGSARQAPYEDQLCRHDPQTRGLALRPVSREMLTASAMQHFEGELRRRSC